MTQGNALLERPIDRFFRWGDNQWGMVFGEPEHFMGEPMRLIGPPDNWDEIVQLKPLTKGADDGIFESVKQARKGKKGA